MVERQALRVNGFVVTLGLLLVNGAFALAWLAQDFMTPDGIELPEGIGTLLFATAGWALIHVLLVSGFTIVDPNEAKVVQFLGRYVGSVREPGFQWVLPLTTRKKVTLRVRNFETAKLKVNDADGNPVEIAAVVVYKVVDTAKAAFAMDDYEEYVSIQAEAAVRHLATSYPYDSHDDSRTSLRNGIDVAEKLTAELRERTALAGVDMLEARITHLAYAPEIAQVMLVRQQATQVVAARSQIVEGAVGMVGLALDRLNEQGVVALDEERKAQMVSNLLVVLCGDRATQPVINAGSLYA